MTHKLLYTLSCIHVEFMLTRCVRHQKNSLIKPNIQMTYARDKAGSG